MTQKQTLIRALDFAKSPSDKGSPWNVMAARAFCVIAWLHDMNWHPEADALETRVNSSPRLARALSNLAKDATRRLQLEHIASFVLNFMCGAGLAPTDWQTTAGAPLVEELWTIIEGCDGNDQAGNLRATESA